MNKTLFIHQLTGYRRDIADWMKKATLEKQSPAFDRSYIHLSVEAYDKEGELLWRFHDGDYDKYRYPLTNARYVYAHGAKEEACGLYITSPEDVATFAATGYLIGSKFGQTHDLSRLNVLYSDLDALKEQSILQNEKYS